MTQRWTQEMENPRERERLWILAGGYRQFEHYNRMFKEYGFEPVYLSEARKVRGIRGEKFIRVGTWFKRRARELDEILEVLKLSDFIEMRHDIIEKEERERRQWKRRHWYDAYPDGVACPVFGNREPFDIPEEFIKEEEMTL